MYFGLQRIIERYIPLYNGILFNNGSVIGVHNFIEIKITIILGKIIRGIVDKLTKVNLNDFGTSILYV